MSREEYRRELDYDAMPERIRRLPIDRGYPVPWFVAWIDGKPEFRAMDPKKWVMAVDVGRCWVCGDAMGSYKAFVIGPMCGVNRTTAEPPCHLQCAEWSAINCPFLSRPHAVRREDDLTRQHEANVAGHMIKRNPGVMLLWVTKSYHLFRDDHSKPLIHIGEPVHVRFYYDGRPAMRSEIEQSVMSGMPALREMAEKEDRERDNGAVKALHQLLGQFQLLWPQETTDGRTDLPGLQGDHHGGASAVPIERAPTQQAAHDAAGSGRRD